MISGTGFNSMKGELVRSIMYPKPVDFRFIADLLKFVGVLAFIAAIGFLYTIIIMTMRGNATSSIVKVIFFFYIFGRISF